MASTPPEKPEVAEAEVGGQDRTPPYLAHDTRQKEIDHIRDTHTGEVVTLASFAHLDEKKILRKVVQLFAVEWAC